MVTVLMIAALVLAGCSRGQGSAEAQKAVCSAVSGLDSTVASLGHITPESTGAEIKALKSHLDTAMAALKTANGLMKSQAITTLLANYDSFSQQVNQLSDSESIGDALGTIQPAIVQVNQALDQVSAALKCAP